MPRPTLFGDVLGSFGFLVTSKLLPVSVTSGLVQPLLVVLHYHPPLPILLGLQCIWLASCQFQTFFFATLDQRLLHLLGIRHIHPCKYLLSY